VIARALSAGILTVLPALLAPPAHAGAALQVSPAVTTADRMELRVQGDSAVLRRRSTTVGADGVIRVWLPGAAAPRTRSLTQGPARRVTVRRVGKRTAISIFSRADTRAAARRLRFLEQPGALTVALFSDDGALAGWLADHSGARTFSLPARLVARRLVARSGASLPAGPAAAFVVGAPSLKAIADDAPIPAAASTPRAAAPLAAQGATPTPSGAALPRKPPPTAAPPITPARRTSAAAPGRSRVVVLCTLVAAAALALLLRRRSRRLPGADLAIRVLSSLGLSGKHRVSVIEVGSDRFLVALDTGGTHLISRLGATATASAPAATAAPLPAAATATLQPPLAAPAGAGPPAAAVRAAGTTAMFPPAPKVPAHRLRLVTPAPIESLRIAEERVRGGGAAQPIPARRAQTAPAVPAALARIATAAVAPAAVRPRTRSVPQPVRGSGATATDPTQHAIASPAEDSDVAGLLRKKSPWSKAA